MDEAEAARQIVSSGLLGALLVVLGLEYRKQGLALAAVQEARVADAKKYAETQLLNNERWQASVNDLAGAIERLMDRLGDRPRRDS
jgi:hypothetical protein